MLRIDPELERISRRLSKIDKANTRARGDERAALEKERAELLVRYGEILRFEKSFRLVQRKAQRPLSLSAAPRPKGSGISDG
jgi:hypothetical protein